MAVDLRKRRWCALHEAAWQGDLPGLQAALVQGRDLQALAEFDFTALHLAVSQRHPACVSWLIAQGADIEAPDRDGDRPLHHVGTNRLQSKLGEAQLIQTLLIRAGADEWARNNDGVYAGESQCPCSAEGSELKLHSMHKVKFKDQSPAELWGRFMLQRNRRH